MLKNFYNKCIAHRVLIFLTEYDAGTYGHECGHCLNQRYCYFTYAQHVMHYTFSQPSSIGINTCEFKRKMTQITRLKSLVQLG